MADYLSFTLNAAESTPWVRRLGRGVTKLSLPGTWAATVVVERRRPDGTAVPLMHSTGSVTAFTTDPGMFDINDAGPIRLTISAYTSGSITPLIWSDESQMDMLGDEEQGQGDTSPSLLWMNGDYFQFMAS